MKSINLVVSEEFIRNLIESSKIDKQYDDLDSMLRGIFLGRDAGYGNEFLKGLVSAEFGKYLINMKLRNSLSKLKKKREIKGSGLEIIVIFSGNQKENGVKYVVYHVCSDKEIHGHYKTNADQKYLKGLISRYNTIHYGKDRLYVTTEDVIETFELIKIIDKEVEIKYV